jgi:diguanylate cyclase (GGDEF)-like protein
VEKEPKLLKILICDDDPQDRKLIQAYLRQNKGREIAMLEAGQTAEIQIALDKGSIDLILMDIQMPVKSGMEWLSEIVEKQVAPVVMLTGFGNEEIAVQSLQHGAIGYLPKGKLSAKRLVATIDSAVEKWRELQASRANQEQLEIMANIDPLTGLPNRRAIQNRLDEAMAYARRYGGDLSVLMLDIDHFKRINDKYGHITGDNVLEKVASSLQRRIRDIDTAGRYGGDEFIIIFPKANLPSALVAAERIRKILATTKMKDLKGNAFSISVSQGLASYRPGDERDSFIYRADDALNRAKQNGRNRVETSELTTSGT